MGCINDNIKFIRTKLYTEMRELTPEARHEKYAVELKGVISSLLKECYPNNSADKIIFYNDSFRSMISHYDSETLMLNLFLEKESAFIVNSLCKSEAFDEIKPAQLSKISFAFLEFINNTYLEKSEFTGDDEKKHIQSFFMSLVPSLNVMDWRSEEGNNSLITKFTEWLKENLNAQNLENFMMAFITFIKLWDCFNEYSKPFNNTKAIRLYSGVNSDIEDRLSNSTADIYVCLIDEIQKITLSLFVDLNFVPLLDSKDSNKYKDGYLTLRMRNKELLNQAREIGKVSSSWSYIDLIKDVSESSPEYLFNKHLYSMVEKIKSFSYPNNIEIKGINEIKSNKKNDILKSKLSEKLYLFENLIN